MPTAVTDDNTDDTDPEGYYSIINDDTDDDYLHPIPAGGAR